MWYVEITDSETINYLPTNIDSNILSLGCELQGKIYYNNNPLNDNQTT